MMQGRMRLAWSADRRVAANKGARPGKVMAARVDYAPGEKFHRRRELYCWL